MPHLLFVPLVCAFPHISAAVSYFHDWMVYALHCVFPVILSSLKWMAYTLHCVPATVVVDCCPPILYYRCFFQPFCPFPWLLVPHTSFCAVTIVPAPLLWLSLLFHHFNQFVFLPAALPLILPLLGGPVSLLPSWFGLPIPGTCFGWECWVR